MSHACSFCCGCATSLATLHVVLRVTSELGVLCTAGPEFKWWVVLQLLVLTSSERIMGKIFVNSTLTNITASAMAALVVGINCYLVRPSPPLPPSPVPEPLLSPVPLRHKSLHVLHGFVLSGGTNLNFGLLYRTLSVSTLTAYHRSRCC